MKAIGPLAFVLAVALLLVAIILRIAGLPRPWLMLLHLLSLLAIGVCFFLYRRRKNPNS